MISLLVELPRPPPKPGKPPNWGAARGAAKALVAARQVMKKDFMMERR
jgi:hypothetical protein